MKKIIDDLKFNLRSYPLIFSLVKKLRVYAGKSFISLPEWIVNFLHYFCSNSFQPFIIITKAELGKRKKYFICFNQIDAQFYCDELSRLSAIDNSLLLQGLQKALELETYESADLFFKWTKITNKELSETIITKETSISSKSINFRCPIYYFTTNDYDCENSIVDKDRVETLENAFHLYLELKGNDTLRLALVESIALALSMALGAREKYNNARKIVELALNRKPGSIHLKAARFALELKLSSQSLPARLQKFIGEDNNYLKDFLCSQPFDRFDIGPDGNVLVCCGHWLPSPIGNFLTSPVSDILNSSRARKIRQSILDGSYKYCNHLDCAEMVKDSLLHRSDILTPRLQKSIATGDTSVENVDMITFALDQSCNLSCPSCRNQIISEKNSQSTLKTKAVEEKLIPLLSSLKTLHINPAGELFSSKSSRRLLELIDQESCPELKIDIISNGTLFSKEEWSKYPGIHGKVRSVRISTDSARRETFEKLRRLGNYDKFCENVKFLRDLRNKNAIPQLGFSFTYQLENFREMPEFLEFCKSMAADIVIFERLQNITFSSELYKKKAIHHIDHPLNSEFVEIIQQPEFHAHWIWHDFDNFDVKC